MSVKKLKFRFSQAFLVVLMTIGIAGCFDSSDDSSAVTVSAISGVASKGIIIGGKVYAYPIIDGDIVKVVPLAEDVTGSDGKYSIDINNYKGPVYIVVEPAADGKSKVKCDVPEGCSDSGNNYNFGSLMPFDYSLEALIPNVTGGSTISASVTPFTHMAAAYAKSLGITASGDTVKVANEKVATLLGLDDVLSVEPVDITDTAAVGSTATSAASLKYGYIAASIAKIAADDNQGDVSQTLGNLISSYVNNQGELVSNESSDDPTVISLAEIMTAAVDLMEAESSVNNGVFTIVRDGLVAANTSAKGTGADTSTDTPTDTVVAVGKVEDAKEIVSELRTWGNKLSEDMKAGEASFTDRAKIALDASESDFEQVIVGMAAATAAMIEAFSQEMDGIIDGGTYPIINFIPTDFGMNQNMMPITATGDILVSDNTISLSSGAIVNGADVILSMTVPENISGTEFTASLGESSSKNTNVELLFDSSFATVVFEDAVTDIYLASNNKVTKIDFKLSGSLGHKETALAVNKIDFSGDIEASIFINYSTWENGEEIEDVNPERIVMDGDFIIAGDSFGAKFELNMANAATFKQIKPEFLVDLNYPTFGSYAFSEDGDTLMLTWPDSQVRFEFNPMDSMITRTRTYDSGMSDSMIFKVYDRSIFQYVDTFESLNDFITRNGEFNGATNWIYNIDGFGSFIVTPPDVWENEGGDLSGLMLWSFYDDDESEDQWRDIDATLTMKVGFKDFPEASVIANIDRTGYRSGTGSLTMAYDDVSIVIMGDVDALDEENLDGDISVVITTAKGKLEIHPDLANNNEMRGSIVVDGEVVGSIKPSEIDGSDVLMVTYVNGDFETVLF